jgi:hypothetical protein
MLGNALTGDVAAAAMRLNRKVSSLAFLQL